MGARSGAPCRRLGRYGERITVDRLVLMTAEGERPGSPSEADVSSGRVASPEKPASQGTLVMPDLSARGTQWVS